MDSAFARSDYWLIVKSGQDVQLDLGEDVAWENWQATSGWQYTEWGMPVAAIFYVVKSAFQSCVPMQTPSVHLALQCLISQILFVTYRVGTCGTHSLHPMRIKSLKDIQCEILCASDKC